MSIRLTFALPKNYHHPARKLKTAAAKHGVKLTSCKRDAYGYYVTCNAPCGTPVKKLVRTKRMRLSHISYAGCDR